ncbi:unnamed protein product [Lathyrus oleraceus]|uniref:F-box/kelch-repeat protein At3g23880-like n=1 Tax=Pisum sativum TaxID=3888 RepID=UPI001FC47964|nr:F-box/kelch-repeat protein At3g23880-like [Pisum sativum]
MKRHHSSSTALPNELLAEIFSLLGVKSLMRFKCVNKSFNSLISDPYFVHMHLNKSQRNPNLTLISQQNYETPFTDCSVITFPISHLLDNSSTIVEFYPYYQLNENNSSWWIVGSCNGLLTLIDTNIPPLNRDSRICFKNPATRAKTEYFLPSSNISFQFAFGYDTLNEIYKVVAFHVELDVKRRKTSMVKFCDARTMVKVFSMGDDSWRNIESFPALPLYRFNNNSINNGVYLSGTMNWLALRDYFCFNYLLCSNEGSIDLEQFLIVSLDLSTETYTKLLLPQGFDKVPRFPPALVVLRDCLCLCHDLEETHFVIWQMKNFGFQESWIQLFKISYTNFFKWLDLLPMYLSENGDTLILANDRYDEAFIYNCKDNRVEKIEISDNILWSQSKYFTESLVSTR